MSVFPLMQVIDDKQFLVVGYGGIAQRKIRLIRQFTDRVTVLTDCGGQDCAEKGEDKAGCAECEDGRGRQGSEGDPAGSFQILRRKFTPEDLSGVDFCIASTDDPVRNHRIASLCREAGIQVNVPDAPSLCTFFLPAVVKRGDLTIAFSTDGKSPALAAYLRRNAEENLPDRVEEILDRMGDLRLQAQRDLEDSAARRKLYHTLLTEMLSGRLEPDERTVHSRAQRWIEEINATRIKK